MSTDFFEVIQKYEIEKVTKEYNFESLKFNQILESNHKDEILKELENEKELILENVNSIFNNDSFNK